MYDAPACFRFPLLVLILVLTLGAQPLTAQQGLTIDPPVLEADLLPNSSTLVDFTLTNNSNEAVSFLFPGFESDERPALLRGSVAALSNAFLAQLPNQPGAENLAQREILARWVAGELPNPNAAEQRIIEDFESRQNTGASGTSMQSEGPVFPITFENAAFDGLEFVLYSETPVSGSWTGYSA